MLAFAACLFTSGCLTPRVWKELDGKKYAVVAKDDLSDEQYARLTTEKRLAKKDTVICRDGGALAWFETERGEPADVEYLRVRKRKITRFALDAAKVLATPLTVVADTAMLGAAAWLFLGALP